jgi:hypothetical protein
MSRQNITSMSPSEEGLVVTFAARSGSRSYLYNLADGAQIVGGADPHDFNGHEVGSSTGSGSSGFSEILEDVEVGAEEAVETVAEVAAL